jgi:sulfur transfer complex TusBCD TusB component (DsrH family)
MSTATIPPAASELLRFTRTHLRHHEAMMRATGGHFNLFQILGIGHYEVRTHSPILAELLSPQGRHGQGDVFLKLFLNQFAILNEDFKAEGSKVSTEYYIGSKTEDSGGRIDIVIQDSAERRILIENKIYAADQDKQITRYSNFDPKARLFYLTLSGAPPSNLTPEEAKMHRCECISYKDHILTWLVACRKEATCLHGLREMLSQYIALIEDLTHKSITKEMSKELIEEVVDKSENLEAFFTLVNAQDAVFTELVGRLSEQLEKDMSVGFLQMAGPLKNLGWKHAGVDYVCSELDRLNLKVRLHFDTSGYRDFCFGFMIARDGEECPLRTEVFELFRTKFPEITEIPTHFWPAWTYFKQPYRNWGHEAFEAIRSGDLARHIHTILGELAKVARQVCEIHAPIRTNPNHLVS